MGHGPPDSPSSFFPLHDITLHYSFPLQQYPSPNWLAQNQTAISTFLQTVQLFLKPRVTQLLSQKRSISKSVGPPHLLAASCNSFLHYSSLFAFSWSYYFAGICCFFAAWAFLGFFWGGGRGIGFMSRPGKRVGARVWVGWSGSLI